jgi:hypothetical protein
MLPPGSVFGHNPQENSMSTYLSKKYAKTGRAKNGSRNHLLPTGLQRAQMEALGLPF